MEFLPAEQVRRTLHERGVDEHVDGNRLGLTLREPTGRSAAPRCTIRLMPACCVGGETDSMFIPLAAECLPDAADRALNKIGAGDIVLIPVERWGPILDLLAFDLAAEEAWRAIDAEAPLHQNTRDPLGMTSKHRRLVRRIVGSLVRGSPDPSCDLVIAALDAPFVLEILHGPAMVLHCDRAIGEMIAANLRAA